MIQQLRIKHTSLGLITIEQSLELLIPLSFSVWVVIGWLVNPYSVNVNSGSSYPLMVLIF
jgi:hypothetical protein